MDHQPDRGTGMDDTTTSTHTDAKRPYRTPELQDLGSVAELTKTATGNNTDAPDTYGTS
jgi:hypothetical protein